MSRDNYLIRMDVWLQLRYLSGCPVRGQLLNLDGCPGPSLICMDVQDISLISLSPHNCFSFQYIFLIYAHFCYLRQVRARIRRLVVAILYTPLDGVDQSLRNLAHGPSI